MSTRFLHGDGILSAICEANARHAKRSLGVASWGADAVERLCLGDDLGDTKIICDLWSEGCEPEAVIALLKGGAEIRHVDGFHAQTFIYVDRVIIGSANASLAGFGEAGRTAPTRSETALLCDDRAVLDEAQEWFRLTWKKGSPVGSSTFEAYQPAAASVRRPSLLHALANEPELFSGLDLVVTVYRDAWMSEAAQATWEAMKGEYGDDERRAYERDGEVPFYELTPEVATSSPPGRIYLDLTRTGKKLAYNGIWKVRSGVPKPVPGTGSVLVMLDRLPSLRGRKARNAEMQSFAKALAKRVDEDDLVLPHDAVTMAAREALAD
ncbi:phospholipase D family protein [Methylorubrum sp. B1-46]|uniref:phospholipase D family protein n=1 Tax=Methylorubrum sp. B1-46 TaxID=2897334 RepID=UPI001E63A890|nr:phospholipase D family protein [Methylorubrum sp. B1-46]UGB24891.1 phospholipase D family protein [Methylorubrum sp. B1-46]